MTDKVWKCRARYAANELAGAMEASYWVEGRDDSTAKYLEAKAHDEFVNLAEIMGYDIVLRAQTDEAA